MGEPKRHIRQSARLPSRAGVGQALLAEEGPLVEALIEKARFSEEQRGAIATIASDLVKAARAGRRESGGVDSFLHEYGLSSEEGVLLLCLAEALLRIPDAATADRLIAGTIGSGDWSRHLGQSEFAPGQRLDLGPDAHRASARLERKWPVRSQRAWSSG